MTKENNELFQETRKILESHGCDCVTGAHRHIISTASLASVNSARYNVTMDVTLESPVRFIPRVGPAMASRLERLEIFTVEDFLYHIPFRYDDFSLVSPIARVQPGETVTITGTVESIKNFYTKTGKKVQEAKVADSSGRLSVIWFNQIYLLNIIHAGDMLHLSGTISWFGAKLVMSNPQYEILSTDDDGVSLHTGRLVPVYPETEGVSSKWMRGRIAHLLMSVLPTVTDFLPDEVLSSNHLMGIAEALQTIHFPDTLDRAYQARRRLAFDELFIMQLRSYEQKRVRETTQKSHAMTTYTDTLHSFITSLPFELTDDQQHAIQEILRDIQRPIPMNRLLEGDVGSGKTVVAAMAMYMTHRNGYQSILMAPTQILAEQHFKTISTLLTPFNVRIGLQTGAHKDMVSGKKKQFDILIGTHALLSESIKFDEIGLVIVDEQHRFGVAQRTKLTGETNGMLPHLLTMTATPIPRTLAKTIFGTLDLSTLNEMPKGRLLIKTWVVPTVKRSRAYDWIAKQLKNLGTQAFIICPLIEESENLSEVKAVTQEYETLKKVFKGFSLGLLHGKLKPKEKTQILADFHAKKYSILVSTPVIEVGIDIPNATVMVIEAAERFGLGQLHQLRGRVGRGTEQSYCLLFTEHDEETILSRLKSMETIHNGPDLAEVDLTLRGPGELFGLRQHGAPGMKIAALSDMKTVTDTYASVAALTKRDPDLSSFPLLREKLIKSKIDKDITAD